MSSNIVVNDTKKGRVRKVAAEAAAVVADVLPQETIAADPQPLEPAAPRVKSDARVAVRTLCLSPRRVSGSIKSAGNLEELKKSMADYNQARRNYTKIATKVWSKGECMVGSKKYTKEDVKEMDAALSRDLKLIPNKCKSFQQSRKRPPNEAYLMKCMSEISGVFGLNRPVFVNMLSSGRQRVYVDESVSLFYITDNVIEFFKNANMGNGIAMFFSESLSEETRNISGVKKPKEAYAAVAAELGANPEDVLGMTTEMLMKLADPRRVIIPLLKKYQMVSSPLLIKLMSQYIRVNELTDRSTRRIVFDANMKNWFGGDSTTRATVGGKDYSPADDDRLRLSGIERMQQMTVDDRSALCDGVSMSHRMLFTLINMYRVKSAWVTEDMKDALTDEKARAAVEGLKVICTFAKPPRAADAKAAAAAEA